MTYYRDKLSLISDSLRNIDLFRILDGKIIRYHFSKKTNTSNESNITTEAYIEYDTCIDENDNIYVVYQDINFDLMLDIIKGWKINRIKLSDKPLPEIYYLNTIVYGNEPHIFYFVILSEKDKKYRIYHHYPSDEGWVTNIVDEITIKELLNPMSIFKTEEEIIIVYYDYKEAEQIYINTFDLNSKKWGDKVRITDNDKDKLYVDLIYKDNKIHLTYCQFEEGNLIVKYERFNYKNGFIEKEIENTISNPESPQNPTLIYFNNRLWISWVEYDSVMSRYSDTNGDTWSSIYLWKESKRSSIVRYKYFSSQKQDDQILNYSFGKIKPSIGFLGFGPLDKVEEVPLKKKIRLKSLENLPRIRI